ncbi:hypothetical protein ACQP2X_23755 [Actinoplanes sp. CA-131856]
MIPKAARELAILRSVYRLEEYAEVEHADRPDFYLHTPGRKPFGVEITELYRSQTDARTMHRPEYIGDLLAGGRHMHRDDIKPLSVAQVRISDPSGVVKAENVPAIIRREPTTADHSSAIAEALRRKSEKLSAYDANVSHTNLVIFDAYEYVREPISEFNLTELMATELRAALIETGYREVYLVAEEESGRQFYRPLRLLLLLEAFHLYASALAAYDDGGFELAEEDVVPLFVHAGRSVGIPVVLAADDGRYCAIFGGCGVQLFDGSTTILDFADAELPAALPVPAAPLSGNALDSFLEHYSNFASNNDFLCAVALDVKERAEIYNARGSFEFHRAFRARECE